MRPTIVLAFAGLLFAAGACMPVSTAQSAHPCEGVPPGGPCTIDQECSEPYTDAKTGEERATCTRADGTRLECFVARQPDGSYLYGCPEPARDGDRMQFLALGAGLLMLGGAGGWILLRRLGPVTLVPALPLFSRVDRSVTLEHPRRRRLHDYIQQHPGVRFSTLRRELEIANGDLRHHLRILQLQGLIVATRRFRRLTFRLPGSALAAELPADAALLHELVRRSGAITLDHAQASLGWSRSKARHWARILAGYGAVTRARRGRRQFLEPTVMAHGWAGRGAAV